MVLRLWQLALRDCLRYVTFSRVAKLDASGLCRNGSCSLLAYALQHTGAKFGSELIFCLGDAVSINSSPSKPTKLSHTFYNNKAASPSPFLSLPDIYDRRASPGPDTSTCSGHVVDPAQDSG